MRQRIIHAFIGKIQREGRRLPRSAAASARGEEKCLEISSKESDLSELLGFCCELMSTDTSFTYGGSRGRGWTNWEGNGVSMFHFLSISRQK